MSSYLMIPHVELLTVLYRNKRK